MTRPDHTPARSRLFRIDPLHRPANTPDVMPLALLPFFWLLALMSSLGAQASEGVPVQQILDQLAQSNQDGQFVENLKPVTHPALVAKGLSHPFMRDGKPSPDLSISGHELRPITPQEIGELTGFFDFPVSPTHVLTVAMSRKEPAENEATSMRMPLQLTETANGYWLVFGTIKAKTAEEPPRQHFTFQEDHQSWRHRWTLQFLPDDAKTLALVITGPDGSAVATLWNAADSPLRPDRPKLSVNLWPEQDEAAFRQGPGGETSVSFGWSSGTKGEASSFNLPFPPSACTYRHIPEPAFDNDRLCLATFGGPGGNTYLLEIRRLPAAP